MQEFSVVEGDSMYTSHLSVIYIMLHHSVVRCNIYHTPDPPVVMVM